MNKIQGILLSFVILSILIIIPACQPGVDESSSDENGGSETSGLPGEVNLTTSDGYTIAAQFTRGNGNGRLPACLLIHQVGHDKSDFQNMQNQLSQAGISSLAIDLRGHGGSTNDGALSYQNFASEDWEAAVNDILAGLNYLRTKEDVDPAKIAIVCASIGANLAVLATADEITNGVDNPAKCLVLLSPGLIYQVRLDPARARDLGHTPVYIASAREDRQSFDGSQTLSQASRGSDNLHEFEGSYHGTELFDANPDLIVEVIDWIGGRLANIVTEPDNSPTDIAEPVSLEGGGS